MDRAAKARTIQANRSRPTDQGAAAASRHASIAQVSGYCRMEAAKAAGSSARMVRAQRSSCLNRALRLASGTVVSGTVSASATRRPREAMRRPSTLSSARWLTSALKPPMRARSCRCRAMVAPRQSWRPIARASSAPGRKPWVIWVAPSLAGKAGFGGAVAAAARWLAGASISAVAGWAAFGAGKPAYSVVTRPTPGCCKAVTKRFR